MIRRIFPVMIVLAVLTGPFAVLAQDGERPGRPEMRERFRNMSEAEREAFRARMRERLGPRPPVVSREEQLAAIKTIEEQLAKLKTAMDAASIENRDRYRELSEEERAALREKMITAMRERQKSVRTMEGELAKLRGPRFSQPDPRGRIEELRAIRKMAIKENASETAKRLEGLIASLERESRGDRRRPELRPRGDMQRPRPERSPRGDSGQRAKPFTLTSFDGKTVSLAGYRGKTVVLEWFNFECPFSKHHYETTTTMVDLAKKYKSDGVIWLAINSTNHTTPAANKAFAARHNLPFPILDDRAGTVGRAYDAKTTPHVFVISPRGQIVYTGAIDNSPLGKTPEGAKYVNYVDDVLAALIANKDIPVRETKSYGCSVKYAK